MIMDILYIVLALIFILLMGVASLLYHIGKHYKSQQRAVQEKYNTKKMETPKKKRSTGNAYRDFK